MFYTCEGAQGHSFVADNGSGEVVGRDVEEGLERNTEVGREEQAKTLEKRRILKHRALE